jgi:Family of unknown function (DUF6496)
MARKYSKGAQRKIKRVMKERKSGTLKSGRSGKKVKSRKQRSASRKHVGLARRCQKSVVPGGVDVSAQGKPRQSALARIEVTQARGQNSARAPGVAADANRTEPKP